MRGRLWASDAFRLEPESSGLRRCLVCDPSWLGGWIMSAPLPDPRRKRFQRYMEHGRGGRGAHQLRKRGHAKPAPQGPPRGKGQLARHRAFLEGLIAQDSGHHARRAARCLVRGRGRAGPPRLDCQLAVPTWVYIPRESLVATERGRAPRYAPLRADWPKHRLHAIAPLPDRVVVIDETAVKTNLIRLRGRARRSARLMMERRLEAGGRRR